MSDGEITPNPGNESNDENGFDFSKLNAETVEPLSPHVAPDVKATKRRWWESRPKGDKKNREKAVKPVPTMPRGGLRASLENFYTGIGIAVMPFDPHCANVIIENAEQCAKTMDELAKTNPAVRRVLLKLIATSALGAVMTAHAPIVMAIMMHHVPALRERQEKMAADMAEMFARMAANPAPEDDGE